MEANSALKDAEKCLELDPKFIKAYSRKGTCHHLMKEYHKALKAMMMVSKLIQTTKSARKENKRL